MASIDIRPQRGPQESYLSSPADIAIYGGAAGGGKTWALLFEQLRHISNSDFGSVIFRRTSPQIRNEGGLWDASSKIYPLLGARPKESVLEWHFPSGSRIKFAHLEHDKNVYDWQGSEVPLICFDELTHFTRAQFFYMLSRNRSLCGVKPYVRCTTNPDADSWVAEFIDWWISEEGYPIKERSGVLRWFIRVDDSFIWSDTREELLNKYGEECSPKSLTFVSASIQDNPILLAQDPGYLANLKALPAFERKRLLEGDWRVRPTAGLMFKSENFGVVEAASVYERAVRFWDLAATAKTDNNDPDRTAGILISLLKDGRYEVLDSKVMQKGPLDVETAILNTAAQDGPEVEIGIAEDPGQAGKAQMDYLVRKLAGYKVHRVKESGDKVTRAAPLSAQVESGNVSIIRGRWNSEFLAEYENFPDGRYKDQVDAGSNAFLILTKPKHQYRIRTL